VGVIDTWSRQRRLAVRWFDVLVARIGRSEILGEPLRDWPEIISELIEGLIKLILWLGILALIVYGAVRFVRWAWYH
jgi:hypothetical protein